MITIKKGMLRKWNAIIAWTLSMFGIACTNIACEYGTPEAMFVVSGTIRSEESGNPIENIQVVMGPDTAYSNAGGQYRVSVRDFPDSQSFDLAFRDVDGTGHGEFNPRDTLILFENPDFTGGDGHWYQGETEKKIDIRLIVGTHTCVRPPPLVIY